MSVVTLVTTNGRYEYIEPTLASYDKHVATLGSHPLVIWDDSGVPEYRAWLKSTYPMADVQWPSDEPVGYGKAIRTAWRYIAKEYGDRDYVWHQEDDFTYNERVPLAEMAHVLRHRPALVQMALRRQAWYSREKAAGGIIERAPHLFTEVTENVGVNCVVPYTWIEHRDLFTLNPCLYRMELPKKVPWPAGARSERRISFKLRDDPKVKFAYWGAKSDPPMVHHIGESRCGFNY